MKRLRLGVFFVFYALAEMVAPQATTALEAAEETEETMRLSRRGTPSRRMMDPRAPAPVCSVTVEVASSVTAIPIEPRGQAAPVVVCKIPSSSAESPSAPEDH